MSLLSELEFASYLVYSPSGLSGFSKSSKQLCTTVKQDGTIWIGNPRKPHRAIPAIVGHLQSNLQGTTFGHFFAGNPILVPAPRSSLMQQNSLYPTKVICQSMTQCGMGSEVKELLHRILAVPKAAFSKPADRPTAQRHFDSMEVSNELVKPTSIVIVDDVITSGTMLLASASKLQEAFPEARIRAFALIRTMSGAEVEKTIEPCDGLIRLRGAKGHRVP